MICISFPYNLGSSCAPVVKTPNGRISSLTHRPTKQPRNCTVSTTDFTTSQSDLEPFPSSPRLGTASHNQSCIVVSPSTPNQHHTIRNIKQENDEMTPKHLYDLDTEIHDCKLHGYQYSTLHDPRRAISKSSRRNPSHKISFPNPSTLSNLAKRSISSQTIYRHKTNANRQKGKKSEHHCHHIDSSPHESPKSGARIPPPPPPPRVLKCTIKTNPGENSRHTSYAEEIQRTGANEDTTSEFEDDDIDDNDDGSQRSTPDTQEPSRYPNSKHRNCCVEENIKDGIQKVASIKNPVHNHSFSRNVVPPESCLTCVNPNHYHHYHHQVGSFITPITLITSSGVAGEQSKHFFLRQSTTPYLHSNIKTALAATQSNVEHHEHECGCGATFQSNNSNQIALNRTLSNPTMVTVPQPHREAPQLHRYDRSEQYNPQSHLRTLDHGHEMIHSPEDQETSTIKNIHEVSSDGEIIDLEYQSKMEIISESNRLTDKHNSKTCADHDSKNQITSQNYLHDKNPVEIENELICPPPPPVPYGTLRYGPFADRSAPCSNNPEMSNTPSSNVESSGGNSNSSSSSVLAAIQTEESRPTFNLTNASYETNSSQKTATTNLVYNHMFKSKFSTPTSTSCTTWNGDVLLHESPTANSSSSSSYLPTTLKDMQEGNNMDSGL